MVEMDKYGWKNGKGDMNIDDIDICGDGPHHHLQYSSLMLTYSNMKAKSQWLCRQFSTKQAGRSVGVFDAFISLNCVYQYGYPLPSSLHLDSLATPNQLHFFLPPSSLYILQSEDLNIISLLINLQTRTTKVRVSVCVSDQ